MTSKFIPALVTTGPRRSNFHSLRKSLFSSSVLRSTFQSPSSSKTMFAETAATRRLFCIANHCTGASINPSKLSEKALADGSVCPPTTPGLIRFYNMRFCPFAQRTRLVLEHKKIPYEIVNVNLKYKPDWFLKMNPQGLVPIIEKDGLIIYESTATCEWLDDTYPENRLQPDDPDRKAWDRMLLEYFGQLATAMHRVLRRPELREKIIQKAKRNFQYFEDTLVQRGGPYFGGSQVAMIDFYLWPHMERFPAIALMVPELTISSTEYPKLSNWFKHMYDRPEVKVTIFDNESHLHFLKSLGLGQPDYDYGLD